MIDLKGEVVMLMKEVEKRDVIIENERIKHKTQLKDFIAAVKVAERRREEAQAEVTRLMDFNRIVGSRDEALWDELMYKYQRTTKRNALLAWADAHLTAYPSISVSNFTSDWCDGRAFCALIHHFQPDIVDRAALLQREQCPELAIKLASKLKVHIDPKLFAGTKPDFKHVMEVVFELYKKLDLGEKNSEPQAAATPKKARLDSPCSPLSQSSTVSSTQLSSPQASPARKLAKPIPEERKRILIRQNYCLNEGSAKARRPATAQRHQQQQAPSNFKRLPRIVDLIIHQCCRMANHWPGVYRIDSAWDAPCVRLAVRITHVLPCPIQNWAFLAPPITQRLFTNLEKNMTKLVVNPRLWE
ncbi:unnamed protein product [Nippostrongylus brasiliensis]|uniref:Calponin-homology (CH) domain-containing protein n=1 Tax=Nippostrongylus brasiliensis TaxID=27835 RepID=A0A0N4YH36_NIPBR|nr:unnamed protein product [Nippostrongylus brasiliensis]